MFFEDLTDGAVFRTGSHVVTAAEIRDFASAYDPQPMHLDHEASAATPFGDIIASGFQTMAVAWRLWVETGMNDHGRGGIGLGDARWYRPVYAGTELRSIVHIDGTRLTSQGKGLATMRFEVVDAEDRPVLAFTTTGLFARRSELPAGAEPAVPR